MKEGEDQATADNDPCPMLKQRLDQDDEKEGDISEKKCLENSLFFFSSGQTFHRQRLQLSTLGWS